MGCVIFAGCSSDYQSDNQAQEGSVIRFSPNVLPMTRVALTNSSGELIKFQNGDEMDVYALYNGEVYFHTDFVYSDMGFQSAAPYYWPAMEDGSPLTFYATVNATQVEPGKFLNFVPEPSVFEQRDVLVAKYSATQQEDLVKLNFRHALSQVNVWVKNSNNDFQVTVSGLRVGYVKTASESFAYTEQAETKMRNADNISLNCWKLIDFQEPAANETYASNYMYEQEVAWTLVGKQPPSMLGGEKRWMLLPQELKRFDKDADGKKVYHTKKSEATTTLPDLSGAYIGLNLKIEYLNEGKAVGTLADQWCYWPIDDLADWQAGFVYSYIVDVATGGYHGDNQDDNPTLDPVLKTMAFGGVSVDVYDPEDYNLDKMEF